MWLDAPHAVIIVLAAAARTVDRHQVKDVILINASQDQGIRTCTVSVASIQSWWFHFVKVHCFWAWQLPWRYMQVRLETIKVMLLSLTQIVESKLNLFVLQTWKWTVGQILWRWCGQKADPRPTRRFSVWVAVSQPASQQERPTSMWISLTVTLGDWYVYIYVKPASCESAIFPTALSGGSLSL